MQSAYGGSTPKTQRRGPMRRRANLLPMCLWRGCESRSVESGDGRCEKHAEIVRKSLVAAGVVVKRNNAESDAKRESQERENAEREAKQAMAAERHLLAVRLLMRKAFL